MGDIYFDYADLFWQNEFDQDLDLRKRTLEEIGVKSVEKIEKFEYFDVYTYSQSDFQDNTMRENALKKLKELHESNVIFEENFSPLTVFRNIADESSNIELEAKEAGEKIIAKLIDIGIESRPCHQDL